ncbi:MAG: DUF4287 domain-containing protein [Flavobacteriaceae bacterium]|jgi:hypothetical protein|nr:DUF4287 domain-containing protein [Flavobacteriaceae bacterium]
MDSLSMEKAMIKNMINRTGKSIDQWIIIAKEQKDMKHNQLVNFLKKEYSITHGYANLIVRKSK